MRPSRLSSEAPEVVSPADQEINLTVSTWAERYKRGGSQSQSQKQVDDRETETKNYPHTPRPTYDIVPPYGVEEQNRRGKVCGLITTIVLVVVAFLIGGGIGGGVGGAIAVNNAKSSTPIVQPTVTVTAPGSQSTTVVDTAGCPLVNNSTYTGKGSAATFLKLCATDILPIAGQNIDVSNSTQSSFDACLDSCAAFSGCVGATWVMFSPTVPSRNSVCFLKNGTGQETSSSVSGQSLVSGFLQTSS